MFIPALGISGRLSAPGREGSPVRFRRRQQPGFPSLPAGAAKIAPAAPGGDSRGSIPRVFPSPGPPSPRRRRRLPPESAVAAAASAPQRRRHFECGQGVPAERGKNPFRPHLVSTPIRNKTKQKNHYKPTTTKTTHFGNNLFSFTLSKSQVL